MANSLCAASVGDSVIQQLSSLIDATIQPRQREMFDRIDIGSTIRSRLSSSPSMLAPSPTSCFSLSSCSKDE